jgi:hypothetical protein
VIIFAAQDKAKPDMENINGLNLVAVKLAFHFKRINIVYLVDKT